MERKKDDKMEEERKMKRRHEERIRMYKIKFEYKKIEIEKIFFRSAEDNSIVDV